MQTLLTLNKLFHKNSSVNGVAIPDQHNVSTDYAKYLFQESDHFFASEGVPIGFDTQSNLFSFRGHPHNAQNVKAVMVIDTGTEDWRLSSP